MNLSDVVWTPSVEPLRASGLLIHTSSVRINVKARLERLSTDQKSRLKSACSECIIVLLGAGDDLPWIPGAVYLGQASNINHLYIPTNLQPSLPVQLIADSISTLFGKGQYVIDPQHHCCLNVSAALPLELVDTKTFPS